MNENNNDNIVEQNSNQNNSKNNQSFKTIIVVVLFLVCFSLGYLFAINFGGSDNKTNGNKSENNTIEDKPVEDNKVIEFDINFYKSFHTKENETDFQTGLEHKLYSQKETYVKDLAEQEIQLLIYENTKNEQEKYKVNGSGVQINEDGLITNDPGYDYLLEYEPVAKLFKDEMYKLFGDNLTYSDDLFTKDGNHSFHYSIVEKDGKKYFSYGARRGEPFGSPSYKYTYLRTEYGNNEAYVYEKVDIQEYGAETPLESYTYKWTFKLGIDNNYHLYLVTRE